MPSSSHDYKIFSDLEYDYNHNGMDWKNTYPECAKTNQSPINFSTSLDAGYKQYSQVEDGFKKDYNNQYEDVEIHWKEHATKVLLKDGPNYFSSGLAKDIYGGNKLYRAAGFQFRHGSEHTINGRKHDLEM